MFDYSRSGLQQVVFFEVLTRNRRILGDLEGVRSATRERNIYASPRTSGSVDLTVRQEVDWMTASVRFSAASRWGDETDGPFPLFTGIPRLTGEGRGQKGTTLSLKLLDYSTLLDVPLGRNWSILTGEVVVDRVRELLYSVGATDAVITPDGSKAADNRTFLGTVTKRKVVNELLRSIGYSAVWADGWGKLHCEPYVNPGDRPVNPDLGFIHGSTCTFKPEFTVDHDVAGVPNHAVVTVRTQEPYEPVVGEAWLPADHPYSYETRQLEVPITEDDVELAVQALPADPETIDVEEYLTRLQEAGDDYAKRLLLERATPARSYVVENRWRPYELHDVTRLYVPARDFTTEIDKRVSVAKDSLRYAAGHRPEVTTTLLEVMS